MKKLFISYSYEDVVFVKKFTLLLSLYGFDVWMDEKNISNGVSVQELCKFEMG